MGAEIGELCYFAAPRCCECLGFKVLALACLISCLCCLFSKRSITSQVLDSRFCNLESELVFTFVILKSRLARGDLQL